MPIYLGDDLEDKGSGIILDHPEVPQPQSQTRQTNAGTASVTVNDTIKNA